MAALDPMPAGELDKLAGLLERDYGQCVLGRAVLVEWLALQFERSQRVGVPDAEELASTLGADYKLWQAEAARSHSY
ncbi:hypothetical protein ACN99C_26745 (plasmid) [Pseudomonas alloputida]|uniref:hypothetical protein n=1 Tax=Pseudomonas alloputida TaxID=1940621 RepID=UPI003B431BE0